MIFVIPILQFLRHDLIFVSWKPAAGQFGGESGMSAMGLNEVNSGHNGSPRGKTNPFPGRMSSLFQRMSSENAM